MRMTGLEIALVTGLFQVADAKKVRQEMTLAVAAAETTLNKVCESS
jgi:hypothetical protein